jgi:Pyridoxamine 5'-phosphate oxidase
MPSLPAPQASAPIMFGHPAPPGRLLSWGWARARLVAARNYWIVTVRPDRRPHARPVWGVWLPDGLWFSTGSLARHNLAADPEISVHLEDGDEVVIVEGSAEQVTDATALQPMCDAYNPKYHWSIRPAGDGVTDADGNAGPAFRVTPRVVFGWENDMAAPTRWTFPR